MSELAERESTSPDDPRTATERDWCFKITNVSKTYAGFGAALHSVTMEIPANARVAILGHSGAGKSTLMHLLGLLDDADPSPGSGIVYCDGATEFHYGGSSDSENQSESETHLDWLRRTRFGFVFQQGFLLEHLSCAENVAIGLRLAGNRGSAARSRALLETLKLGDNFVRRPARRLSGGQKQRVAILRALAHDPRVVFADEPTGHLDPENARLVMRQLVTWQGLGSRESPRTLLLVTHDERLAFDVCDYFVLMREGRVLTERPIHKSTLAHDWENGVDSAEALSTRMARSLRLELPESPSRNREEVFAPPAVVASVRSNDRLEAGYLAQLAWKDTIRPEYLWITLTTTLILLLMSLLCLIGLGLLDVKRRIMSRELDSAQARRLDVALLTGSEGEGDIDENVKRQLEGLTIRGKRAFADPQGQIARWNMTEKVFYRGLPKSKASPRPPGDAPEGSINDLVAEQNLTNYLVGRSAEEHDPFLKTATYVAGRQFDGFTDMRQIVVSRDLLQKCGLEVDAPYVSLVTSSGPLQLKVMGVVEKFEDRSVRYFVIPDLLQQSLVTREVDSDPAAARIWLRNLPADMPRELPAELANAEFARNLIFEMKPGELEIRVRDGGTFALSEMRQFAVWTREILEEQSVVPRSQLQVQDPPSNSRAAARNYAMASLYVNSVDQLEDVAVAISAETDLKVIDEHFLRMVRRMRNTLGPLEKILWFFIASAAIVAMLATSVNMWQRVRHKRHEIGILRSCGMTCLQLVIMYALAGCWLAVFSAGVGVPLSYVLGRWLAANLSAGDSPADIHYQLNWFHILLVTAGLTMICVGSCLAATFHVARQPPVESIR